MNRHSLVPPLKVYPNGVERIFSVDEIIARDVWLGTCHGQMVQMLKRVKAGHSLDTDDLADLAVIEAGYPGETAR